MKYHISVKFIAILLATVFLAISVGSAVGIIGLAASDLYSRTVAEVYNSSLYSECHGLAVNLVHRYASLELGGLPESYLETYWGEYYWVDEFRDGYYFYTLRDHDGKVLTSNVAGDVTGMNSYEIDVTNMNYRKLVELQPLTDTQFDSGDTGYDPTYTDGLLESTYGEEQDETTEGVTSPTEEAIFSDVYYDYEREMTMEIFYTQARLGKCTVTVYLQEGALEEEPYWELLRLAYSVRYDLFWVLAAGLVLFAACAVYLCCAAGRKPGQEEARAGGLNRIPLDIYLILGVAAEVLLIMLGWDVMSHLIFYATYTAALAMGALFLLVVSLIFVAFCYACAAQFKTGKGFWWRNCLVGRILRPIWRGIRRLFRGCGKLIGMLPTVWQLVVTVLAMVLVLFITYLLAFGNSFYRINLFFVLVLLVEILVCLGILGYAVYAFGVLKKGAAAMAQGDLHQLVPTGSLIGPFRTFAWELNRLSGAARRAAEQQLKSERMKTELITNVSHDIKTPLTSIINYVDLLEKPHTEEEGKAYLEVLSRQSQRLKKLIDDLMDMSKASTGNLNVELQRLDAAEAVNQALGEFSDKLAKAGLVPVLRSPDKPAYVLADGKLVWRVMSNLLGNVVKYAMPGTRVYVDLCEEPGKVLLSVKNISREALNVSADELAERFVRGDASRNTEGSGLGLNIAKSLMELQRGSLDITVDGDLFKVTLTFPAAE